MVSDEDPPLSPARVRTVPAHDELHRHGESLVLLDGQVQRVSALGTVIREVAVEGIDVADLATVLEECFGAPDGADARALTQEAVSTMLQAGLLSAENSSAPVTD